MSKTYNQKQIIEYEHYDVSGSENTKTMLLLHGSGVNRKIWIPQMIALSHTYRILAPDMLGHASRRQEKFTFKTAVTELNSFIEQNNYGKLLVAGLSLGGYLASEFVCQYPDKTTGLVLIGSSATPRGYITIPYHLLAFFYRIIDYGWLVKYNASSWRSKYKPEVAEPVIEAGFYHAVVPQLESEIGGKDFLSKLKTYEKPVLIINGEKDHIFRRGERLYRKSIRNSRIVVIKNAGHMCNLDAPEEFNKHLREFADSLSWD